MRRRGACPVLRGPRRSNAPGLPDSEAGFKTLKYCPAFPQRFASITEAKWFCDKFFHYYNTEHRHSGIGLHTPAAVHDGTATEVRARRTEVLTAAYAANPQRFRSKPTPPALPKTAWINPPKENVETEQEPDLSHRV